MARRSKYNESVHQRLVDAIRVGATREDAAKYAGISDDSLRRWLAAGERGETPFVRLFKDIEAAEGQAVVHWLAIIDKAAREDNIWQAAAWKLERRYPQHYGRRNPEIQVLLQGLTDDELLRVATAQRIAPGEMVEGETVMAPTERRALPAPDA